MAVETSPKPHRWTIVLSFAALFISLLSWREAHLSRVKTQALLRPWLEIAALTFQGDSRYGDDVDLILKNSGNAPLTNLKVQIENKLTSNRPVRTEFTGYPGVTDFPQRYDGRFPYAGIQ